MRTGQPHELMFNEKSSIDINCGSISVTNDVTLGVLHHTIQTTRTPIICQFYRQGVLYEVKLT